MSTKNWIQKIGIGTVQFGLDYGISNQRGRVPQGEVQQILDLAAQHQICLLDTARAYGESEKVLGKALGKKSCFKIVSKLPSQTKSAKDEVLESLSLLEEQSLYAYLFHNFQDFEQKPALWDELVGLKAAGLIQKVGFSLYYPEELETLWSKNIDFDLIQIPYNIFDRRFEPYFQKLKEKGVEIHIRSVFLQGLFFMPLEKIAPHFAPVKEKLTKLERLAAQHQLSRAALPLWFALQDPNIDKVILGLSSIADLVQNLELIESFATHQQWFQSLPLETLEEDQEAIILPFKWKV
jgi:aryl-alcohol dehydrogenase-like predicted oxidoreductase